MLLFFCTDLLVCPLDSLEPQVFPEPERFERAGSAPFTFVPFGGGLKDVSGNEFARMVIVMAPHHLVTQFSWALEDPNESVVVDPIPFPVKGPPILLTPHIA